MKLQESLGSVTQKVSERRGGIQGGDTQLAYAVSNERAERRGSNIEIFPFELLYLGRGGFSIGFPTGALVARMMHISNEIGNNFTFCLPIASTAISPLANS